MLAVSAPPATPSLLDPVGRLTSVVSTSLEQLLARPLEFVEGSSSGVLAVPEGRYRPINAVRKPPSPAKSHPLSKTIDSRPTVQSHGPLHSAYIPLHYPQEVNTIGAGFLNIGNTCFLNSVLQCLLHSPPLLHLLRDHERSSCRALPGFCAVCSLRELMMQANTGKRFICPDPIVGQITKIAKHFRRGRQEDAHEFLRYLIEAMQKSCLAGLGPKPDHNLTETTWVHRIFGGRLRSRVKCRSCGHPSDTFDSVLDLSIDVNGVRSLKESLHKFVKLDVLKGADRYKCEKCKQFVIADKGFTVHDAPTVLTIHMKRFTPFGRKIINPVRYDEHLDLQPYMSDGQFGPTYRLFGVINHAGKGPNSGHYYAYVKSSKNRWYEMNDESVEPRHNAMAEKNAYILLYIRETGQTLKQFTSGNSVTKSVPWQGPLSPQKGEEDLGVAASTTEAIVDPANLPVSKNATAMVFSDLVENDEGRRSALQLSTSVMHENADEEMIATPSKLSRAPAGTNLPPASSPLVQSMPAPSLKRKHVFTPARHLSNNVGMEVKRVKRNNGMQPTQLPGGNPFGGRAQYRDNLKTQASSSSGSSSPRWSRQPGLQNSMRKRKRPLI